MPFKVQIVYEHEGFNDVTVAEYPIEEVKGTKVKFLPPTNQMKKDILEWIENNV